MCARLPVGSVYRCQMEAWQQEDQWLWLKKEGGTKPSCNKKEAKARGPFEARLLEPKPNKVRERSSCRCLLAKESGFLKVVSVFAVHGFLVFFNLVAGFFHPGSI